ncbi:hypothetical protein PG995_000046 [Apiospora arundinis]
MQYFQTCDKQVPAMVPAIDDPWVQLALKVGRNGLAATASYAVQGVTPRGGGCCRDVTAARLDGVWIHAFPDGIPSPYESDRECEMRCPGFASRSLSPENPDQPCRSIEKSSSQPLSCDVRCGWAVRKATTHQAAPATSTRRQDRLTGDGFTS